MFFWSPCKFVCCVLDCLVLKSRTKCNKQHLCTFSWGFKRTVDERSLACKLQWVHFIANLLYGISQKWLKHIITVHVRVWVRALGTGRLVFHWYQFFIGTRTGMAAFQTDRFVEDFIEHFCTCLKYTQKTISCMKNPKSLMGLFPIKKQFR